MAMSSGEARSAVTTAAPPIAILVWLPVLAVLLPVGLIMLIARRLVSPRMTLVMQTISMFGTLPALTSLSLAVIAWLLKAKRS